MIAGFSGFWAFKEDDTVEDIREGGSRAGRAGQQARAQRRKTKKY